MSKHAGSTPATRTNARLIASAHINGIGGESEIVRCVLAGESIDKAAGIGDYGDNWDASCFDGDLEPVFAEVRRQVRAAHARTRGGK